VRRGGRALVAVLAAVAVVGALSIGTAAATGGGKTLLYGGAGQGRVVFDGRVHAAAGFRCTDCHADLFTTQKQARITMEDHGQAKACFACHDDRKAFATCESCHRKP
jgi:thiosulfate reductase cytochrome b subunit